MDDYTLSISAIRVNMGWTRAEMAKRLGVTRQTMSHWENGNTKIPAKILVRISDISGVPLANIRLPGKPVKEEK